jgi:excisionase family DNA binding protein
MPKLWTVPEVMKALRVSRATIYRLMARHELPIVKVGRRTLVMRQALDAFIQRQQQECPGPAPDDEFEARCAEIRQEIKTGARRTSGRIVPEDTP